MSLKYPTPLADLVVHQKVLRNAYSDIESGDYPVSGRLCEDIAKLGLSQELVIEEIFRQRQHRTFLQNRLAARVCENCVLWKDCKQFVPGDLPIDFDDQFSLEPSPGVVEDSKVVSPVTPLMRPRANRIPISA